MKLHNLKSTLLPVQGEYISVDHYSITRDVNHMPNCLYVCTSNQLLHTSYPSIVTHNKVPKLGLQIYISSY
jgi:hypothetical protein